MVAAGLCVGFTGTSGGMTLRQFDAVTFLLIELQPSVVRHGDCIGADEQFHDIACGAWREPDWPFRIEIHPPLNPSKRARCDRRAPTGITIIVHPEKEYLARNQDIAESDVLIATPKESTEVLRSGTWSTVRRARKLMRTIYIVWPDGTRLIESLWPEISCNPPADSPR